MFNVGSPHPVVNLTMMWTLYKATREYSFVSRAAMLLSTNTCIDDKRDMTQLVEAHGKLLRNCSLHSTCDRYLCCALTLNRLGYLKHRFYG